MNWDDVKGMKFYILYCMVVVGVFIYSGITGWKWYNDTPTQSERPATTTRGGHIYRYHK